MHYSQTMTQTQPPKREWSTIGEAAYYLGVSTVTLRRWDASGELPAERNPYNHRRYSRNQLAKALRNRNTP